MRLWCALVGVIVGADRVSIVCSRVMLPERYQNHWRPRVLKPSTVQLFIPAPGPVALMLTSEFPEVSTTWLKACGAKAESNTANTFTESQRRGHRRVLLGSFITADPISGWLRLFRPKVRKWSRYFYRNLRFISNFSARAERSNRAYLPRVAHTLW